MSIAGRLASSSLLTLVLLRVRVHVHHQPHRRVGEAVGDRRTGVQQAVKPAMGGLGQLSALLTLKTLIDRV